MTRAVDYLFLPLMGIWIYPCEETIRVLVSFENKVVIFLWICWKFSIFSVTAFVSYVYCRYLLPHFAFLLFYLRFVVVIQHFFILMNFSFSNFSIMVCAFCTVMFEKVLPTQRSWSYLFPLLSSRAFIILTLTFRSMIHLELTLMFIVWGRNQCPLLPRPCPAGPASVIESPPCPCVAVAPSS